MAPPANMPTAGQHVSTNAAETMFGMHRLGRPSDPDLTDSTPEGHPPTPDYKIALAKKRIDALMMLQKQGQKATNKPSRMSLEVALKERPEPELTKNTRLRTILLGSAYPPSITPISSLTPITIADLLLETHHTGKVLFVRTFGIARQLDAFYTIVEDAAGDVDCLAVYNIGPQAIPQDLLPQHRVFAVKEPYYRAMPDGTFTLQVDHPSDLKILRLNDPIIPSSLAFQLAEADAAPLAFKGRGNSHYQKKEHRLAIDMYSAGIEASTEEGIALQKDLYRNRSAANMQLGRHEAAVKDALASMLQSCDGVSQDLITKYNCKALFRAGCASIELRQYEEAENYLADALKLNPNDADSAKELARARKLGKQSKTGIYDFQNMIHAFFHGKKMRDQASFLSKVRIDKKDGRLGLLANQAIKAGELVLCERAFEFGSIDGCQGPFSVIMTMNGQHTLPDVFVILFHRIIEKLDGNPLMARRFLAIPAGAFEPSVPAMEIDGGLTIDIFHVYAILERHFAVLGNGHTDPALILNGPSESVDICETASCANWSCLANTYSDKIDNMEVMRAVRDIAKDEEITISRIQWGDDLEEQMAYWRGHHRISCSCRLCHAMQSFSDQDRDTLRRQSETIEKLLSLETKMKAMKAGPFAIMQLVKEVEQSHKILTRLHDNAVFRGLPRPALMKSSVWFVSVLIDSSPEPEIGKRYALETLRNFGFSVTISNDTLTIHRRNAVPHDSVVYAANELAERYKQIGKHTIADAFGQFAKQIQLIMHNEPLSSKPNTAKTLALIKKFMSV